MNTPPSNNDLEMSVLGAMLLDVNAFDTVSDIMTTPEIFYYPDNKKLFEAIVDINNLGGKVDMVTVTQRAVAMNASNKQIPFHIMKVTEAVSSTAHLEEHARILKELYMKREQIKIGSKMMSQAFDLSVDVFDSVEEAEQKLFDIKTDNRQSRAIQVAEGVAEALKHVDHLREVGGDITGVDTGFSELNRITAGWQRGDSAIIAAKTGVGKTSFAINAALSAAHAGQPTAIFSLEMSQGEIINRMLANLSGVNLYKIQRGYLDDDEGKLLMMAGEKLAEMPVFIDDTPMLTVAGLRTRVRSLKRKHGLSLAIVDYLQLMTGDGGPRANREREVASISRGIKIISKECDLPMIALSQLSRESDKRDGPPKLSDLRESGAIEQDSSLVMFLHRPSEQEVGQDASLRDKALIRIAKHRHGTTGDIVVGVDLATQRWKDIEFDYSF